jgi:hypothetical protein
MKDDKHKSSIPETAIQQIHQQISGILTTLQPFVTALTSHERQSLLKMGDKSLALVEKARDYVAPTTTPIWSPVSLT